jgi:hypothetical protein
MSVVVVEVELDARQDKPRDRGAWSNQEPSTTGMAASIYLPSTPHHRSHDTLPSYLEKHSFSSSDTIRITTPAVCCL